MAKEKHIFHVNEGSPSVSEVEEVNSTLEYIDVITELTEGTDIEPDLTDKVFNVYEKAKELKDENLLSRAYDKIINYHLKLRNDYAAGLNAIKADRIKQAHNIINRLIEKRENSKALDLAQKINSDTRELFRKKIEEKARNGDLEEFKPQLTRHDNKHKTVYIVRSPHPDYQGGYFLKTDGTLGRNYKILPGFLYQGVVVKRDILERLKYYKHPKIKKNLELLVQLYLMNEDLIKKKTPIVKFIPFNELKENIDGYISIVGVNHYNRSLFITEPIVRFISL